MGIPYGGFQLSYPMVFPWAFHLGIPWGCPWGIPMEVSSLTQVWFGAISSFHSPTRKSAARNSDQDPGLPYPGPQTQGM